MYKISSVVSYVSIFTYTWSRFQVENRIRDSLLSYGLIVCIKDGKWSLLSSSPFPILSLLYEHCALSYLPSHSKFPNLSQMALCPSRPRASLENVYFWYDGTRYQLQISFITQLPISKSKFYRSQFVDRTGSRGIFAL